MGRQSKNKGNKGSGGISRRWFANLDGWGVAFQVGSGEPPKHKRSLPVPNTQKFLSTAVNCNMTHNTLYTFNPLGVITQGVQGYQRVGSGINLKGISFRFFADSGTVSALLRVMIVASEAQFSMTNFGSGLGTSNLFFAGLASPIISHVDSRLAKVICDTTYELKPPVAGQPDEIARTLDCQLETSFAYQSGSVYGEAANIYIVVCAVAVSGVTGTTAVVNIYGEVLTSWSD